MDARDKALKQQVDGMVAPAAAVKTLVDQIDARDKALKTQVDAMVASQAALKAQVDGMVAPAAAVKTLVDQIDARDKALKTQVDALAAKPVFLHVESTVNCANNDFFAWTQKTAAQPVRLVCCCVLRALCMCAFCMRFALVRLDDLL